MTRAMKYENVRMTGDNDKVRYVLRKDGDRPLVVVGLNPSTANEAKADATMTRVMGIAERNGFDSFIMLNLYPQRTTDPAGLDRELNDALHQENLRQIKEALKDVSEPTVLLAFGNNIGLRPYLKTCLRDIVAAISDKCPRYVQAGTPTKWGNPRHPLYAGYPELTGFDIDGYLNK